MIRVLIVDDQNLIRQALQMYLEAESDIKVVGQANDGLEAIEKIQNLKPDLTILDIEMPGMDGITTIKVVAQRFPENKILVLSSHNNEVDVENAMQSGAKGYLLKNTPAHELADAIRYVYKGYCQLSPGLLEKLIERTSQNFPEHITQLEEKFNQRIDILEKSGSPFSKEAREDIITELQLTKKQLVKVKVAYKRLEQQFSWIVIYLISLTILFFTGVAFFIFVKL
ncbi:two component transcriptional regulator, LuxR family [Stanieria cyanosphaera PCC 7437]|uniref:Two component transcriptional regulator, LuxR family n=1 Tax=Stanieria cyanosphaera (strain ATCC 29371 / PCC 7437) TaxID=111780 RepID=K9XQ61_STAC7|nr:response regulator transcription factor [Stanieria cyanosphaera]AFZ33807.1 two component transcriptional regulator, LuxR family [Stanieria cyanosphaera PCC 7437]